MSAAEARLSKIFAPPSPAGTAGDAGTAATGGTGTAAAGEAAGGRTSAPAAVATGSATASSDSESSTVSSTVSSSSTISSTDVSSTSSADAVPGGANSVAFAGGAGGGSSSSDADDEQRRLKVKFEPVPNTIMFRDTTKSKKYRPTMETLRGTRHDRPAREHDSDSDDEAPSGAKFGTWDGVFARCLLNIFGVIMFLRLTWVVANAGVGGTILIVAMCTVATGLTSLSLSAICTNGEVKGGGAYYLISRSLGPEFGGAIGLVFAVANAVAVALYLVGFAESIIAIYTTTETNSEGESIFLNTFTGSMMWDLRIIATASLIMLVVIVLFGVGWVVKVDLFQLVLLIVAILLIPIGALANKAKEDVGFTPANGSTFADNLVSDFREEESFWSVLAVFFPAVTGIMAGANISGDLKNAQENIPKGTLWAVAVSGLVYSGLALTIGSASLRDVNGGDPSLGIYNDPMAIRHIAAWGPWMFVGVIAATLSSALASLVGAPRVLQAVARDDLFFFLRPFAKGSGKNDEPIRGYLITFVVAFGCILIGELNVIAALITNFFLISYALVNYACFAASVSRAVSWRPRFKYYHPVLAILGALLCLGVMFLISWLTSLITIIICAALYKYIEYKRPNVNWGSAAQGRTAVDAVRKLHQLSTTKEHIKTYRPHFLVLTGEPRARPDLIAFTSQLAKQSVSLIVCGNVLRGGFSENRDQWFESRDDTYLEQEGIKAALDVVTAPDLRTGAAQLTQNGGIGKLRLNTTVIGYKEDWQTLDKEELSQHVGLIRDAFDMRMSALVTRNLSTLKLKPTGDGHRDDPKLRMHGRIDVWWTTDDGGFGILLPFLLNQHAHWKNCRIRVYSPAMTNNSNPAIRAMAAAAAAGKDGGKGKEKTSSDDDDSSAVGVTKSAEEVDEADEAGANGLSLDDIRMISLLNKFRIDADPMIVNLDQPPSDEAVAKFEKKWNTTIGPDEDLTRRYLRVGELIKEHSSDAALVFCTLPVPKDEAHQPSSHYMRWLEAISRGICKTNVPLVFARGNQSNVLTYRM